MKIKQASKAIAFSAITTLFLIGCGGGGSNDNVTPASQDNIDGKAIDGYLKYATVCLDLDGNGYCQIGTEPATSTDENGSFSISLTSTQKAHENFDKAMLLVYDGEDSDTGKRYEGKLKAPNDGNAKINITPITTQVAAVVNKSLDANMTKEQIQEQVKAAKSKVKQALNLPDDIDVGADPIALAKEDKSENAKKFLGVNLALHKAIDTMVEAAKQDAANSGKNKDQLAEEMFEALAFGMDDMEEDDVGVVTLLEKTASNEQAKEKMGDKVAGSYKAAAQVAQKTEEFFVSDDFDLDAENIDEQIIKGTMVSEEYKEFFVDKFDDEGFDFNITDEDFEADLKFDVNVSEFDFEKERLKNIFADQNLSDDQLDDLKGKVDDDASKEEMAELLKDDDKFANLGEELEKELEEIEEELEKDKEQGEAAAQGEEQMATLKEEVEALLDPSAEADVDDAKNLFANLRETVTTFIDLDNETDENNTSTIIGAQAKLITDKIQPATESIVDNFKHASQALEDTAEDFGKTVNSNFSAALKAISTRVESISEAIGTQLDNELAQWSDTVGSDSVSYVASETDTHDTLAITLNGTTISIVDKKENNASNDGGLEELTTTGSLTLNSDDYSLSITSLSFSNNKATFKANGKIEGENGSTMSLNALDVELALDRDNKDSMDFLSSANFNFDGEIVSSGRTMSGALKLSATGIELSGSLEGKEDEPGFEGTIKQEVAFSDAKDVLEDDSVGSIHSDSIVVVTFANGEKSLVKYFDDHGYSQDKAGYEYTLFAQNGQEVSCLVSTTYEDNMNKQVAKCTSGDNDVSIQSFTNNSDTIVTAKVNGETRVVNEAWLNNHNNNSYYSHIDFKGDDAGHTYVNHNDKLMIDEEEVTITDIQVRDRKYLSSVPNKTTINGEITKNDIAIGANIVATSNIDSTGLETISIVAEDVVIKDGSNYVKADDIKFNDYWLMDGSCKQDAYSRFATQNYYQSNCEDTTYGSLEINNAAVNIADADGSSLTFNADLSISEDKDGAKEANFNGEYTYAGTKFTGVVEVKDNENTKATLFDITGEVQANNFKPFSLAVAGSNIDKAVNAYALFERGDDYKIGLKLSGDYVKETTKHTEKFELADSNGVLANQTDIWYDNQDSDENNETGVNFTNKSGTKLATYGEASNGNDWEIIYFEEDGFTTTETLF